MALKGSKNDRHEIRNALDRKLWAGNVNDAVIYLKNLDHKFIKNTQHLEDAIEYLERKQPYIPCYALMSSLVISALLYNRELRSWLIHHEIPFAIPTNLSLQEAA